MSNGMGLGTIARANIRRHPGRAALMLVGMAVAVAAFVTVVSLVLSLRATLDDRLARYGASLVVTPASPELSLDYGGVSVADAGSGVVPVLDESAVTTILRPSFGRAGGGGHPRPSPTGESRRGDVSRAGHRHRGQSSGQTVVAHRRGAAPGPGPGALGSGRTEQAGVGPGRDGDHRGASSTP